MPKATARRRAAAPKPAKKSDDESPITTEEQEAEIAAMRRRNEIAKRKQEQGLDTLVILSAVICVHTAFSNYTERTMPLLYLLPASQAFLLLYSLTPGWIPPLREASERAHGNYVAIQLFLFTIGFFAIQHSNPELPDFVKLALPELAAGAVEIQRRGQKDTQARIAKLDELKYDLKGA
ncbi:hypothetical protein Q8F55_005201 [Vanrija albida]|uniref:Glycerophosphocholine acyltransferase 1 n=1 Tax=Vanrija albida TaxID=181172 RepID=A0ABR3Q100_9TREE